MTSLRFEWDEAKNRSNRRKHGVSFEEARTAFLDENTRAVPDPDHSDDEERFVLLGISISLRVQWCATATGKKTRSFESSRPAKRTGTNSGNTSGGSDEKALRLLEIRTQFPISAKPRSN
jgi:uncharacterized DUF497 family protein